MKRKLALSERLFRCISYVLLTIFALLCLYPFVYAVSASISSRYAVDHGDIVIVPGETNPGYRMADGSTLWLKDMTAERLDGGEEDTQKSEVWVAEWPDGTVGVWGPISEGSWKITLTDGSDYQFSGSAVKNVPEDGKWFIRTPAGVSAAVSVRETETLWYIEDAEGSREQTAQKPSNPDEYPAWGLLIEGGYEWIDERDVAQSLADQYNAKIQARVDSGALAEDAAQALKASVVHRVPEPGHREWYVVWPGNSAPVTLNDFPAKSAWGALQPDGTVAWSETPAEGDGAFQLYTSVSRFSLGKGIQFDAFIRMFTDDMFWNAYSNTLFLTIYGTVWSLLVAILGGYALSKKRLLFRKFFNFFLVFTMWFSAGIVPQLINYRNTQKIFSNLGIMDDKWLIVIAMGMAAMNIILLRNAFENVPGEIEEASIVDGATEFQVMTKVFIPMSKSTIATVALFFAISRWNGYFWAKQMITNRNEIPLQVFINETLTDFFNQENTAGWSEPYSWQSVIYALIVCSIVPILIIYPFIQKYFAKGTNAGGVKE